MKPTDEEGDSNFIYKLNCEERPDVERLPEGFWDERIYNLSLKLLERTERA